MLDVKQLAILGTGLLGGSIGLGLRAAGFAGKIIGFGRTPATLEKARQRGCIDEGHTRLDRAVAGCKLIILATPISTMPDLLRELSNLADDDAIVTDIGSTKQFVCDCVSKQLKTPTRFVGSHPMAGSERHGPDYASADLFEGKLCILTPDGTHASPAAVAVVESLWQTLGMRLTVKTPAEHDQLVASISHLPHAIAALLVELADRQKAISVASTGFRDTTRVASGDVRVWLDIFTSNRAAMLEAIDQFTGDLSRFRAAIATGDEKTILATLTHAKQARDAWVQNG